MGPTRVLHVEDSRVQLALIVHYLGTPDERKYVVTGVDTEDDAIDAFSRGGIDLVILDYKLAQGDGLSCLRHLRRLDEIVPVLAVSSTASPAIAAEVMEAGADDYVSKHSLTKQVLDEKIEKALARANNSRARLRTTAWLRSLAGA